LPINHYIPHYLPSQIKLRNFSINDSNMAHTRSQTQKTSNAKNTETHIAKCTPKITKHNAPATKHRELRGTTKQRLEAEIRNLRDKNEHLQKDLAKAKGHIREMVERYQKVIELCDKYLDKSKMES
jgi:hypothetical protein